MDDCYVTQTRYGGVYEGGAWAAFAAPRELVDGSAAFGDDLACDAWWGKNSDKPWVAVGDTADVARRALAVKQGAS